MVGLLVAQFREIGSAIPKTKAYTGSAIPKLVVVIRNIFFGFRKVVAQFRKVVAQFRKISFLFSNFNIFLT